MNAELAAIVEEARRDSEPMVLATLLRVDGSSFRRPGARVLLDRRGPRCGVISGGCVEAELVQRAREVLRDGSARLARVALRGERDLVFGHGSGCTGELEVLLERFDPGAPWLIEAERAEQARRTAYLVTWIEPGRLGQRRLCAVDPGALPGAVVEPLLPGLALLILGAWDDARPLAAAAQALGYRVAVADPRAALLTAERFPGCELVPERPAAALLGRPSDARQAVVLLTHAHSADCEALQALGPTAVGYVGLLGSRSRIRLVLARVPGAVSRLGNRLRAPVGLDLGGDDPGALALAILAEAHALLHGRPVVRSRSEVQGRDRESTCRA